MGFFKKIFSSKSDDASSSQPPVDTTGPPARGVVLNTTLGEITIEFFPEQAPKAVQNFTLLSRANKYNNTPFHRIIPGFMIQGGDFTRGDGTGGKSIWGKKFEDEFSPSLTHDRKGVVSMANSGPRTNGSQFFITLGACHHLDSKHTIFGQVVKGLDVVDRLGSVPTGELDRPKNEVVIISTTVID